MCFLFRFARDDLDHDDNKTVATVTSIKEKIPQYATRQARHDFKETFTLGMPKAKPAMIRAMFRMLTGDQTAPANAGQRKVDDRLLVFLLFSDDPNLIYNLRATNGQVENPKYVPFWDMFGQVLEEDQVPHERRMKDVCYAAKTHFNLSID